MTASGTVSGGYLTGPLGIRVSGDTLDRWNVDTSGRLVWGTGSAAADVALSRQSAGVTRLDAQLQVGSVGSALAHSALPRGVNANSRADIMVTSSFAGGEDDGSVESFDSTGRISLYAYQRASYYSYGESIRHFLMRSDAKTMQATYLPIDPATRKSNYDPTTREPKAGSKYVPVSWQGTHFEANSHTSIHGHWELEIPDSTGALQGRLEITYTDQSTPTALDQAVIGVDWTNIRTNLADLSVRAQNITSGPYSGQNTMLRVGGGNTINKDIGLSISSDMTNQGRRWLLRANTTSEAGSNAGTDFQIIRHDDSGGTLGTAIGIERSTGNILIGATPPGANARLHVVPVSGKAGVLVTLGSTIGAKAGFAAELSATTERGYESRVTTDTLARHVAYVDGKHEWGDGTASRDTNLYRSAAGVLKTDQSFYSVGNAGIGGAPDTNISLSITQAADKVALYLNNTLVGGSSALPLINANALAGTSPVLTSRVTGEAASRFYLDISGLIQWGSGAASRDTNLYRSAVSTLKTDNNFVVGSTLDVTGAVTAPSVTTTGAVSAGSLVVDGVTYMPKTFVKKTSNETRTSTTTITTDAELTLAVAANSVYQFEAFLIYDGDVAGDLSLGWTIPASSTLHWVPGGPPSSQTTSFTGQVKMSDSASGSDTLGAIGTGTKGVARVTGLLTTVGTAGTLALKWAQATSSATATTIYTDSFLTATKVG